MWKAKFSALAAVGLVGAIVLSMASATNAAVIFSDTFDSAGPTFDNPAAWSTSSSAAVGRIQVTGAFGTAAGIGALLMDRSVSGTFNRNEAILTVNLSGCTGSCSLSFFHADFNDEQHGLPLNFAGSVNGDGVSISDDGINWLRVLNATNLPFGFWASVTIDLAQVASAAGLTLGANFQIKFQQFDNFPLLTDGRGYDQILIQTPEPATLALFAIGLAGLGFMTRRRRVV